jgi:hypothetical protein
MLIGGEVRRHPVEDDADAMLVQIIDQVHQVLGRAVATGGGIVSCGLIAPGAIKRMLHERHEFDVREAQSSDVIGQSWSDLTIGQRAVPLLGHAHPRAEVHFIDGYRGLQRVMALTRSHPLLIPPTVGQVPDDRRRSGRCLAVKRQGIAFIGLISLQA